MPHLVTSLVASDRATVRALRVVTKAGGACATPGPRASQTIFSLGPGRHRAASGQNQLNTVHQFSILNSFILFQEILLNFQKFI
jgi:hypothetical protein